MELKPGYKLTEVGVIPNDWDVQSLEEIADPKRPICYGIVQVGPFVRNGIPVLAIKNLNVDYFASIHRTSHDIEAPYARSRVRPGDVLISVKGTTGRVGIVPANFDGNISRDIARLRLTDDDVPAFWFHLLQSDTGQREMGLATVGTTRMELSIGILKHVRMPRPPKQEQRAIAGALSDVDALIGALDQLLAKKRDLKQAAMQQLLTGQTRLPGFHGEWDVSTLGQTCSFENGDRSSNYPSPGSFRQSGIPFINAGQVAEGQISSSEMNYITQEAYGRLGGGKVKAGDILFCLRGSLGKFGVVSSNFGHGAIASSLVIIRPKKPAVSREYLSCYFSSALCAQMIETWSGGAAQPNLGAKDLARFSISLPPSLREQTAIAEVLSDMDAELAALEQKRDKTRLLKQGMMQELLTGRTRLI